MLMAIQVKSRKGVMILDNFIVYMHKNKSNEKVYIGITGKSLKRRSNNGNGYDSNSHFSNAIKKYGWDNFESTIVYNNLTKEAAALKEMELISNYKSNNRNYGYNLSTGGESPARGVFQKGRRLSEETKEKIRQAHIGKYHGRTVPYSVEELERQNNFHKNHIESLKANKEYKERYHKNLKIAVSGEKNGFYGRKHTDKTRKILSENAKMRILSKNPNAKKIKILLNDIEYEFGTMKECAEFLNISYKMLYGRIKNNKIKVII